jgi:hypothetical protein
LQTDNNHCGTCGNVVSLQIPFSFTNWNANSGSALLEPPVLQALASVVIVVSPLAMVHVLISNLTLTTVERVEML